MYGVLEIYIYSFSHVSIQNTGTTAALTNDIDLVVFDANGGQHLPILSSGNDGVDSVNTVEHVSVTGNIPSGT